MQKTKRRTRVQNTTRVLRTERYYKTTTYKNNGNIDDTSSSGDISSSDNSSNSASDWEFIPPHILYDDTQEYKTLSDDIATLEIRDRKIEGLDIHRAVIDNIPEMYKIQTRSQSRKLKRKFDSAIPKDKVKEQETIDDDFTLKEIGSGNESGIEMQEKKRKQEAVTDDDIVFEDINIDSDSPFVLAMPYHNTMIDSDDSTDGESSNKKNDVVPDVIPANDTNSNIALNCESDVPIPELTEFKDFANWVKNLRKK